MSIPLSSNFLLSSSLPLDARTVVADSTARLAIPSIQLYIGLQVFEVDTGDTYTYKGASIWQLSSTGSPGLWEYGGALYPVDQTQKVVVGGTSVLANDPFLSVHGGFGTQGELNQFLQLNNASGTPTAALAGLGAGNLSNGDYRYKLVLFTASGSHVKSAGASNLITVSDNSTDGQMSITDLQVPSNPLFASKALYRDFNEDGIFKFVATLAIGDTSYVDNIANDYLGAELIDVNQTGAVDFTGPVAYEDRTEQSIATLPDGLVIVNTKTFGTGTPVYRNGFRVDKYNVTYDNSPYSILETDGGAFSEEFNITTGGMSAPFSANGGIKVKINGNAGDNAFSLIPMLYVEDDGVGPALRTGITTLGGSMAHVSAFNGNAKIQSVRISGGGDGYDVDIDAADAASTGGPTPPDQRGGDIRIKQGTGFGSGRIGGLKAYDSTQAIRLLQDSGDALQLVQMNGVLNGTVASFYLNGTAGLELSLDTSTGLIIMGNGLQVNQRTLAVEGTVASANNLSLPYNTNSKITGTTDINLIDTTDWIAGSTTILRFQSAGDTVKHNQTPSGSYAAILCSGSADYVSSAGSTIHLYYDGTNWLLTPMYTP